MSDIKKYLTILLSQEDKTICPDCIKKTKPKNNCDNLVLWKKDITKPLINENCVLVCCYISQSKKKEVSSGAN